MPSLHDRLSEDLKHAMKARDQLRMDTIRMIKSALFNKEIELKKDLDEAEMNRVLTVLVKQRKEIVIVEGYLPRALSQEEITKIIESVIQETDAATAKDMGNVMKAVMAKLAGQAVDGKLISDLVRARLKQG